VAKVVDQLKQFGETRRGWLGVRIQDMTPEIAESMGLAEGSGALVTDVPEGPARVAGITAGDVITRFAGQEVADAGDLTRRVADAPIGEAVPVIVLRDGRTETLEVTLGRREEAEATTVPASAPAAEAPKELETLGLTLAPLDDEVRTRLGLDASAEGLVVMRVDQASEAFTKGLAEGDLITEAGQQKVVRLQDLEDRIKEAKDGGRKSILLLVRRGGDPRFVALSIQ
jgi:serine protease Do